MNNLIPNEPGGKSLTTAKLSATAPAPAPTTSAAVAEAANDSTIQQQRMTRDATLEMIREKTAELMELTQSKDRSKQLAEYFGRVAVDIRALSECTQDIASVLGNWDYVFATMGLMNAESGNPTIVNLPIVSDIKND